MSGYSSGERYVCVSLCEDEKEERRGRRGRHRKKGNMTAKIDG